MKKMATETKHEIDELLVFGYIRCDIDIDDDEIPMDIINLCMLFYHLNFEILSFSTEFCGQDIYQFTQNNQCVTVLESGHNFILADVEPVTQGIHCWRIQVNFH